MSQVNVSHLTFDNDNTIYNLEDETARAEIAALHAELTQAEYDALTPEEKNNGTEYFITDSTDSGDFSYLEDRLSVLDGKSNTLNEIATLEVTDVKGVIHSSASPKYTFIKNKGENGCYISATDDVGEGADGTILLQSNSTIMLENISDVNYICKSGKTTIICICFQNSVNDPFARDESIGSSGGDGGGTLGIEDVVLWENTSKTQNPSIITLTDNFYNYDEVIVVFGYIATAERYEISGSQIFNISTYKEDTAAAKHFNIQTSVTSESRYNINSETELGLANVIGENAFSPLQIIGRRYTRVSPTGYRQTVLWENTGTTNPDTITLSEAWSDFDELAIVTVGAGGGASYETSKHTRVMAIGSLCVLWYNSEITWGTYYATSSTVFTKSGTDGDYHIAKIIGIKY